MIVANTWHFWGQTERPVEAKATLQAAWTDDLPAFEKVRALRALTAVAMGQNDNETVITASRERLALARELGDLRQQSAAMGMLAGALYESGDVAAAREWFEEAVALDRDRDSPRARSEISDAWSEARATWRARESSSKRISVRAALSGNELDIAYALKELAMTATEQGSMSEACDLTKEGLDISTRVGLSHVTTDLLFGVAILGTRTGRSREAAILFGFGDGANEREGFEVLPTTTWWWKLHDQLVADLGTEVFERLRQEGRSLDSKEAVTLARASSRRRHDTGRRTRGAALGHGDARLHRHRGLDEAPRGAGSGGLQGRSRRAPSVVRQAFGRYQGYEVDYEGDAFFYRLLLGERRTQRGVGGDGGAEDRSPSQSASASTLARPSPIRPSTSAWTCTRPHGS
jgi:tetratricopeptide (TPR) repeat protein